MSEFPEVAPCRQTQKCTDLGNVEEKARPIASDSSQVRLERFAPLEAAARQDNSTPTPRRSLVRVLEARGRTDDVHSRGPDMNAQKAQQVDAKGAFVMMTYVKNKGNSRMPVKIPSTIIITNVVMGGSPTQTGMLCARKQTRRAR